MDDFRKYGSLPNNFALTLPDARQAVMVVRAFKDEYLLDYINNDDADSEQDDDERELNKALVREVKKFILAQAGGIQDFSPRPENLGMTELTRRAFREASRKMEKSPFSA